MSPRTGNKAFDAAEAKKMVAGGTSWTQVAAYFGTTTTTVRCWIDPEYAAHCRQRINTARRIRTSNDEHVVEIQYRRPPEADIAARLAEIPPDTRTLTQRIAGDPVFERSALYRKMQAN